MSGPHPTAPAPGSQPGGAIRWAFLDVGNVLLDEDPLTWLVFRRHAEAVRRVRPDRSLLDLVSERASRAAVEAVGRLSRRFRLGLIANHPSPCRARLAALGLLDRCEVVLLSEEQGLSK